MAFRMPVLIFLVDFVKVVLKETCSGHRLALKIPLIAAPSWAWVITSFGFTNCRRASSVVKSSFLC